MASATAGGAPAAGLGSVGSRGPERAAGRMAMSAIAVSGLIVAMSGDSGSFGAVAERAGGGILRPGRHRLRDRTAIFATEEELADVPRTPLYRAYLPPYVDLKRPVSPGRRSRAGKARVRGLSGGLRGPLLLQQCCRRRGTAYGAWTYRAPLTSTTRSSFPTRHATADPGYSTPCSS